MYVAGSNWDEHAFALGMYPSGTVATILGSIPMFWILFVTYNEKSIIVQMLKKIVNSDESIDTQ